MSRSISEPPETILAPVPEVSIDGKNFSADLVNLNLTFDMAASRRQKTVACVTKELALCGIDTHVPAYSVGLSKFQGRAGPTVEDVLVRVKEVRLTFSGWPQQTSSQ